MSSSKIFKIITLGCKVNQYESDKIRHQLLSRGLREARDDEEPDIYLVNTCAVTREASRKSRQIIRRAEKMSSTPIVYAMGCAAEIAGESLGKLADRVNLVLNRDKENLAGMICHNEIMAGEERNNTGKERTRAYLKVQDGCDNFCSYCIIPYLRGRSRSRKPLDILDELHLIEAAGYREVVLTGIHLGDYGKEIGQCMNLPALLDYLLCNSSIPRFRLSSLEPMDFSFDLPELFARHSRLCPHLHLPLQHGSCRILKLMNRHYTLADYDKIVNRVVEKVPGISITTDVIIGFPGEEDRDFEVMYDYIKDSPLFMIHVFPFSAHPGTKAYSMEGVVPGGVKKERVRKMLELRKEKICSHLSRHRGKTMEVLVEKTLPDGTVSGHTMNYLNVVFPGERDLEGKIIKVDILNRMEEDLYGKKSQFICNRRQS